MIAFVLTLSCLALKKSCKEVSGIINWFWGEMLNPLARKLQIVFPYFLVFLLIPQHSLLAACPVLLFMLKDSWAGDTKKGFNSAFSSQLFWKIPAKPQQANEVPQASFLCSMGMKPFIGLLLNLIVFYNLVLVPFIVPGVVHV